MKLFNYILEVNMRARRPWSHFKIHPIKEHQYAGANYGYHIVWGRLSVVFGQPHLMPVEVHRDCGGLVENLGEDAISYCTECEHICEGDTEFITLEEFEKA